jgi:hypothetical protein
MMSFDDVKQTTRRNKLLGLWAVDNLGLTGAEAERYSTALARDTIDPERSDVFSRLRKDFDAAGVAQSDEEILGVMSRFMLVAGRMEPGKGTGREAAAVMLARNLTRR